MTTKYTQAQQLAIDSNAPEILVLAGPGSGKTATTVGRIRSLIEGGTDPRNIAAITFTNAAARELEERIGKIIGKDPDGEPIPNAVLPPVKEFRLGYVGTLHGFALRCLKKYGESIGYGERIALIDEDASADLMASKAQALGCKAKLKDLLLLKGSGFATNGRLALDQTVVMAYRQELRESGLCDFDSLLTEFRRLIAMMGPICSAGLTHLFVDEVQDSALIDWEIYDALLIPNKFFVGDSDQAIYSFRGGDVSQMVSYSRRPRVVTIKLEHNFRSRAEICDAANLLIKHNTGRIHKDTISVKGPGGGVQLIPVALNEGEEIGRVIGTIHRWIPEDMFDECAVLARTNALCATFRDALKAANLPVKEPAKSELPKDWTLARALVELLAQPDNDALAYFFIIQAKIYCGYGKDEARQDAHAIRAEALRSGTTINYQLGFKRNLSIEDAMPLLAINKVCAETRMKIAELQSNLPAGAGLLDLALAMNQPEAEKDTGEGITVTTYHGAKGREWEVVFLVGTEEEAFARKSDTPDDVEESRRLFYVGLTRARQLVFISHAKQRKVTYGKFNQIQQRTPARFIKEISA